MHLHLPFRKRCHPEPSEVRAVALGSSPTLAAIELLLLLGLTAFPLLAQTTPTTTDLQAVGDTPPVPRSIDSQPPSIQIIFRLTNDARLARHLPTLVWSPELAAAAQAHAQRMASDGQLSHQYAGEPDLAARAAQAGAHFTSIAENIANGPGAAQIVQQWLHSPPHQANILDPRSTALGIAVVASSGTLYAVQDFAATAAPLSLEAAERQVETELLTLGIPSATAPGYDERKREARRNCPLPSGLGQGSSARFILRWEGPSLVLPQPLVQAALSQHDAAAAVGACPPLSAQSNAFTLYRIAVLLY